MRVCGRHCLCDEVEECGQELAWGEVDGQLVEGLAGADGWRLTLHVLGINIVVLFVVVVIIRLTHDRKEDTNQLVHQVGLNHTEGMVI